MSERPEELRSAPKCHYAVLGVLSTATDNEIVKVRDVWRHVVSCQAYRQKSRECHPDKNPGDERLELKPEISEPRGATALFQRINEAHTVLKDKSKRHWDITFHIFSHVFYLRLSV